jgi:hypothetical protein
MMELVDTTGGEAYIMVVRDDVLALLACINEAVEAVSDPEFQTRTGFERADVEALRAQLKQILAQLPRVL